MERMQGVYIEPRVFSYITHNTISTLRKLNTNANLPSTMQFTFRYPSIVFYIIFLNIQVLVKDHPLSVNYFLKVFLMENIL